MLGDLPACSGFGVGSMIAKYGPHFPFEHCREVLEGSDVVIGNLEVVLSRFDVNADPFASTHLRAQPEAIEGLVAAGFSALNLANNHIMQHGRIAVHETVALLRARKIAFTGILDNEAGIENFCLLERNGVRAGLLGYNFRPEQYKQPVRIDVPGDRDTICRDIEAVRNKVDFLVLSLHWGEEFIQRPSGEQVRLGRSLVDAGAHVLLGHHPHILQGVEKYRGRVIAYSLGNFVFDLWQERLRKSMILKMTLDDPDDIRFEITPVFSNRKWQPVPLRGEKAAGMLKEIEALTSLIDAEADETIWKAEVARELRGFRRSVRNHYLTNIHRFNLRRLAANVFGIVKRRLPV